MTLLVHDTGEEKIMHGYPIHTLESAPSKSKQALERLVQAVGTIPNLAGTMAESPTLINSFVCTMVEVGGYELSAAQRQVLLLTNAVTNRALWPVAFHSTLALKEGVARDDVSAIRAGRLPDEPKLAALSALTRSLIEQRGHIGQQTLQAFVDAGFRRDQVLDVVATLALSVMANYTANIAQPPLEAAFEPQAWSR